jgi:signal transduction histidine kinase
MSLRVRLAIGFAAVALATAAAVAVAAPIIVGRGFAQLQQAEATATPVTGSGAGAQGRGMGAQGSAGGAGPMAGMHASQVQAETETTLVVVAILAALVASALGAAAAGWLTRPLARLESAARGVAGGDLSQRSGLAARHDEFGSLGRTFDGMADELERADAVRRRLFADVAHELKTPLAVIEATSSAVLDGVYTADPEHLRTIRDQSRLMARIVDELRTISLAEAGQLALTRSPVDVRALLRDVAHDFEARATSTTVRLSAATGDPLTASVDRDRLRQALAAIVDNALRFAPHGSEVLLEARREPDGSVRLAVRDTGPGIPPGDLPHVFERFYQADDARDRTTATSGLGLSIVRAIARAHGGAAGAANLPDGGAEVWVSVPA